MYWSLTLKVYAARDFLQFLFFFQNQTRLLLVVHKERNEIMLQVDVNYVYYSKTLFPCLSCLLELSADRARILVLAIYTCILMVESTLLNSKEVSTFKWILSYLNCWNPISFSLPFSNSLLYATHLQVFQAWFCSLFLCKNISPKLCNNTFKSKV